MGTVNALGMYRTEVLSVAWGTVARYFSFLRGFSCGGAEDDDESMPELGHGDGHQFVGPVEMVPWLQAMEIDR